MTKAFELLRKYEEGEKARGQEWQRITSKVNEIVSGFDKYLNDGRESIAEVKLGFKDNIGIRDIEVEGLRYEADDAVRFVVTVSLFKSQKVVATEYVGLSCKRYHAGFAITVDGSEEPIIVGGYLGDNGELFDAMYVALEGQFFGPPC
ncbi:hypothetical protein QZH44_06990 [Pseudomonas corrugata]|uniref:hypothetical protein n=1 Tax=Pseudomonas corrugata TaxID=47879 RepID=UPI003D815237